MNTNALKVTTLATLLIATLVLSACGNGQARNNEAKEEEAPAIPVEVTQVKRGPITAFYSTTSTLEADREARVVPRLAGNIDAIYVEEGDFVTEGQRLARIDNERYRIEVARAQATLQRLEQDFNRSREMYARSLISSEAFERAKFEFDAQRAQFALAQLDLSYTEITAPITGVVSERMIKVGNMVNAQNPVFVITSMHPLLATLHVPERELARLAVGQPAFVAADALAGRQFPAQVSRISPVIDATTGTFRVTVEVSGEDGVLKPGMFGRVNIVHDRREDTLLIPVEAVITEDARSSVFVIVNDKAERRTVRVGYRNNGHVEIVEGVSEGELVVITGQASLRNQSKVSIISGGPQVEQVGD